MTLKATQGQRIAAIRKAIRLYHFLLMVCSMNVSTLRHFRDIIPCTGYVSAWDRLKSCSFDKSIEITSHVWHL